MEKGHTDNVRLVKTREVLICNGQASIWEAGERFACVQNIRHFLSLCTLGNFVGIFGAVGMYSLNTFNLMTQ